LAPETWSGVGECNHNRIYNNTFYKDHYAIRTTSNEPHIDNIFKNNIFYNSQVYDLYHNSEQAAGFHYFHNNFYPGNKSAIVFSKIENIKFRLVNSVENPLFADEANEIFTLSTNSTLIDAAEFLTIITSESGSGKSFTVADASYFIDGWGITDGDKIQLEGNDTVVKTIKIVGNTITVDNNISWNKGDGVSLSYNGSAPDIGAVESGNDVTNTKNTNTPPSSPVNLRISGAE